MIWSVTSCFGEFIENKDAKVSYRGVIYLKELCRELNGLCELEFKGQELEEQVCARMVYINFNSPKLVAVIFFKNVASDPCANW